MTEERSSLWDSLREIERQVTDAETVLANMRVTTEPMRADEMTDIEQRRVTALGYLAAARDTAEAALEPNTVVKDGRRDICGHSPGGVMSEALVTHDERPPGDKEIASRLWGILMHRMTPLQIRVLQRITQVHPTTSELAMALDISPQHAGNLASSLYREGFLRRERAGGRQYRWFPAFPAPLPYHYFDRTPITVTGEAAKKAEEILKRRGKL